MELRGNIFAPILENGLLMLKYEFWIVFSRSELKFGENKAFQTTGLTDKQNRFFATSTPSIGHMEQHCFIEQFEWFEHVNAELSWIEYKQNTVSKISACDITVPNVSNECHFVGKWKEIKKNAYKWTSYFRNVEIASIV